jgi:hypothetical protein
MSECKVTSFFFSFFFNFLFSIFFLFVNFHL